MVRRPPRDPAPGPAELTSAERGVPAAFTCPTSSSQRLFRLLGLHPGHDVDVDAVSAKAEGPAEPYLEELLDVHMLQQHHPGRYTLHDDLMRQYARRLAEDTPGEQRPALTACSTAT